METDKSGEYKTTSKYMNNIVMYLQELDASEVT